MLEGDVGLQVVLSLIFNVAYVALVLGRHSAILPSVRAQRPHVFVRLITIRARDFAAP